MDQLVNVISDLEFSPVLLDNKDSPNRIFETLNYRGMALDQSDLVRNLFMMSFHDQGRTKEAYETYWLPMETKLNEASNNSYYKPINQFFYHFLTMKKGVPVNMSDIYSEMRKILKDSETDDLLLEKLKEVTRFADLYQLILLPEREKNLSLSDRLKILDRFPLTVHYPFLLKVYDYYSRKELGLGDVISISQVIESYFVRRYFHRSPTNSLNKLFASLCNLDRTSIITKLVERLVSYDQYASLYWPSDDDFKGDFIIFPIFKKSYETCRLVLDTMEVDFAHPEPVQLDKLTIEHIMPQTLNNKWKSYLGSDWENIYADYCHTMGNLTLIAGIPNSEIQQELFKQKKVDWYQESHVELTRELDRLWNKWGRNEIIERGNKLAERALQIWKRPSVARVTQTSVVET